MSEQKQDADAGHSIDQPEENDLKIRRDKNRRLSMGHCLTTGEPQIELSKPALQMADSQRRLCRLFKESSKKIDKLHCLKDEKEQARRIREEENRQVLLLEKIVVHEHASNISNDFRPLDSNCWLKQKTVRARMLPLQRNGLICFRSRFLRHVQPHSMAFFFCFSRVLLAGSPVEH